jgi:hypothetical protein
MSVVPIIHMNGTSADRLCEALSDAYYAASKLMDALKQCAPNGRDYYPMPGLMEKAVEQHGARMQSVTDLQTAIEKEIEGIMQQTEKRGAS